MTDPVAMDDATPDDLSGRVASVERAIVDFQHRSAHRETVIDRLHEENQRLRAGLRRDILEPVVADLIRLFDCLTAQAERLAAEPAGKMPASFADEVEMSLEQCGLDVFTVAVGDPFDAGLHTPVGAVSCESPDQHNTVALLVAAGLRERDTGRIRRLAKARFHQYRQVEQVDANAGSSQERER